MRIVEPPVSPSGGVPALPPAPHGTTTIVGGTIRYLDLVRDQFSLALYGQRPMKILFDERTQVFRDGVKIPLRDLRPENHASVQTILDGSNVFAVSIHILSQSPEGECQGRVLSYDPRTGELDVITALSLEPIKLVVPADASIARQGQSRIHVYVFGARRSHSGRSRCSHVPVRPKRQRSVASQITILAIPGSSFLFAGNISYLDLSIGLMNVQDPLRREKLRNPFCSRTRAWKWKCPSRRKRHRKCVLRRFTISSL